MEVMATNMETMNVIAKGMEKEASGRDLTELNEMTFDIAATLAWWFGVGLETPGGSFASEVDR